MKASETPVKPINNNNGGSGREKPHFRPAKDDTKPVLQDPVSISLSLFSFIFINFHKFILSQFRYNN